MKVLVLTTPNSFFNDKGKLRYAKLIQQEIDKKEYTDIFLLVYDDTRLNNNSILAMRWVRIFQREEENWMQDFWCDESFFFTKESLSFSFQETFIERLRFIKAIEVDVCGDDKNNFQQELEKILENENIKATKICIAF